ncbi:hypothetical protein DFQ30_003713, partial [Apophysomyces sp. BC1015]
MEDTKSHLEDRIEYVLSIDEQEDNTRLKRTVGPFSATMIITGVIIGSGVFSTPSGILRSVGSVGMSLLIWVIGALISVTGVLAYLELGSMLPRSGGEKEYLEYGIIAAAGGTHTPPTGQFTNSFEGTANDGGGYATAMFKVLFSFDGWNNA